MVNKVTLVGYLGKDPEEKDVNGRSLTTFSMATSEKYKNQSGEWVDKVEWHQIAVFGNIAKSVAKYLAKGSMVYLEGKLTTNSYTDKDGNQKKATNVVANLVKFLDSKGEGGNKSKASSQPEAPVNDEEDDLPF